MCCNNLIKYRVLRDNFCIPGIVNYSPDKLPKPRLTVRPLCTCTFKGINSKL